MPACLFNQPYKGFIDMATQSTSLTVHSLRCEYLADPIGVGERIPRLSWKLAAIDESARGLKQSAYQILVASSQVLLEKGIGDLWDSGRIESDRTVFIDYAGKPLKSSQRVYWNVRIWDQDARPTAPSKTSFWEMGLLDRAEWKGQWIGSSITGGTHQEAPPSMVRKAFSIAQDKRIISARLYATALGFYEFHINGRRVGNDIFTPGWTDYRIRAQYQAYDVTELLQSGENVAGAWIADGWYCGYQGNLDRRQYYGEQPKLLVQLAITFDDGSTQAVATDESWKTSTGEIISADLMMGQHVDARHAQRGWNVTGFDDHRWPPVTIFEDTGIALVATPGPTVRETQVLKPVLITPLGGILRHRHLVDFGQNLVGHVRLTIRGARAGEPIRLRHAEVLDKLSSGSLYTANLRSAKQMDVYTPRGEAVEVFDPQFVFHGFRFVEIESASAELSADDVEAIVVHSNYESAGSFECSDETVNQLQRNIQWGWRGNSIDVPTDCPQRNERLGWTGDAQVFIRTAAFNYDVNGFFAKWTQDLRDAQRPEGDYPAIVPKVHLPGYSFGNTAYGDGGPAWADAGVICPWTMWLCYGDVRLVERHYESMSRFVNQLYNIAREYNGIRTHPDWKGWAGYGDWLAQDAGPHHIKGLTPPDLIGTAFLVYDAKLLAQIARALGKEKDAVHFENIAAETRRAFQKRFVTPDGLLAGATQTSYVLALHFDLLPDEKSRATALDWLARDIEKRGDRLATGFVGSPYLAEVLSANGRLDMAYRLLMQKDWPSWLFAVTQGATTIWERWDGWTPEHGFQNAGMNSFNHYAYGAIGAWLYERVAGISIDPSVPGYARVRFTPHPLKGGPLTHAKASIETHRGLVTSAWRIDGNQIIYDLTVPPNTTATALLPTSDKTQITESGKPAAKATGVTACSPNSTDAIFELQSGVYSFRAPFV